tara:strand:+ start:2797 stop:4389 length:1593 start_codon:yes stop_codon:yes gene_type:complete
MAGIAPVNEAMGPMKLEDGGDPGFLDQIRSYYDENLSGIPAGLAEIGSNLADPQFRDEFLEEEFGDMSLLGEGGLIFDHTDPIDQASVVLLAMPPALAYARLAKMGSAGSKILSRINKIGKKLGDQKEVLERAGIKSSPFQDNITKKVKDILPSNTDTVREAAGKGLRSAVGLQGISLLPEVPELIEATPELFEQAGGAISDLNELGQYLNEQKTNEEGIAQLETQLNDLNRAEEMEEQAGEELNQVARSIAEAREMGVDTFVNKGGKELAAVTKEELDEFRDQPGNEELGYTEALRKYLNEKNAMEMNRGGIAKLNLGGMVFPEVEGSESIVNKKSEEPKISETPNIPEPVITSDVDPTMVSPGLFPMLSERLSNMDPSTAAGFAALTSRRPRGQSAISAFMDAKMDYKREAAEIARDEAATIPGQVEAYRKVFPDITDEELESLILSGGKSEEQQIRELAGELYAEYISSPEMHVDTTGMSQEVKQNAVLKKAIRDARMIVTGDLEGLEALGGETLSAEEAAEIAKTI